MKILITLSLVLWAIVAFGAEVEVATQGNELTLEQYLKLTPEEQDRINLELLERDGRFWQEHYAQKKLEAETAKTETKAEP